MLSPVVQTVLIVAACLVGAALLALLFLRRRNQDWLNRLTSDASGISVPGTGAADTSPRPAQDDPTPLALQSQQPLHTPPVATASAPRPDDEPATASNGLPTSDRTDMLFGGLTPMFASLLPESAENRAKMKRDLIGAGYYQPHAWHNISALRYLGITLPILAFGLLLVFGPTELEPLAIAGMVVGPIVGWAVPKLYVQMQASERKREIERAMPDMLDMVNMCVSQGMTLPAALSRVSHEIAPVYPALSQELAIVSEQGRIGSLEQALNNLSQRVDVPEVHSFTSLLVQTERLGTSVSAALGDHSDNIRESLRQRADKSANTAAFKLLFPTALFLMPAVFLFLLGPAIVDLTDFFNGEAGAAFRENRAAAQQQLIEFSEGP